MQSEKQPIAKSILLLSLFLLSLFAAAVQHPTESTLTFDEVESTSGGVRHLYTFADGSSEATFNLEDASFFGSNNFTQNQHFLNHSV